jgi:pyrroline-5-carboxylate reductase
VNATTSEPNIDAVHLPNIAMLGAGSMGRAILAGLLAPHVQVEAGIQVTNRAAENAAAFDEEPRVTAWATSTHPEANRTAVRGAKIVLVAVKPVMVPDLLDQISSALEPGAIIVSVAGGVTTATLEAHLPAGVSAIRSMPNTPAKVGLGVTGICAGSRTTAEDLDLITRLFATVGDVLVVPESQMDAVGAISGSGPAYVFYFIEALTQAAIAHGLTPEQADLSVRATFRGAVELLEESGETPTELRRQVTSPKGSTERVIAVFDEVDLPGIFVRATAASIARSQEMALGH